MNDIKPIETIYKGFRFRSRLEARWAVFLDEMHIEYQYEVEGYRVAGELYLPDFYLPGVGVHVEVKPSRDAINEAALRKLTAFSVDGDKPLLLIVGYPTSQTMHIVSRCTWDPLYMLDAHEGSEHLFSTFWEMMDSVKVYFAGLPLKSGWTLVYDYDGQAYIHHLTQTALSAAKQARFEHGQKG